MFSSFPGLNHTFNNDTAKRPVLFTNSLYLLPPVIFKLKELTACQRMKQMPFGLILYYTCYRKITNKSPGWFTFHMCFNKDIRDLILHKKRPRHVRYYEHLCLIMACATKGKQQHLFGLVLRTIKRNKYIIKEIPNTVLETPKTCLRFSFY